MSELIESKTKALVVITGQQQKQIQALTEVAPPPCAVIVIETNEQYTEAGAKLLQVRENLKQLEAVHEEIGGPLKRALVDIKTSTKKLAAFFDVPKLRLEQAEAVIKGAMNDYLRIEETKRIAAQKLLDDAAAKEKARIKALADAAAKKAADEAAAERERARRAVIEGRAKEAIAAAAKADIVEARAAVRADIAAVKIASLEAPVVASEAPKAAGTTSRKTWTFQIMDNNQIPDKYWALDVGAIRKAIAAGVRDIPGVHVYEQSDVVLTGK